VVEVTVSFNAFSSNMKSLALPILILASSHLYAQQAAIPHWFMATFTKQYLNQKYELSRYLKPTFLEADFNGDGIKDVATVVTEKKTHKPGILLMHGNTNQQFVFGAGSKLGPGSDNFKWLKRWRLYEGKVVHETILNQDGDIKGSRAIKLKTPGIEMLTMEDIEPSPVAIIYWNGKKYIWIHEGE
jgi:hypothetical protein